MGVHLAVLLGGDGRCHVLDAKFEPGVRAIVLYAYGGRRILFVGHHAGEALNPATGLIERNGLSIVDVTDPSRPTYLTHFPPTGAAASGTQHVQVCDGSALPNADDAKVYAIRTNGLLSYEVLDVTDPAAPKLVTTIAETGVSSRPDSARGNRETHKFQWDCATGIAYMNGTAAGWRVTRVLQAFDVSDPAQPKHVRDFGLVGYEPTSSEPYPAPQVAGLHQPFVVGDRMYLGYNSGEEGVLQIVDRERFISGDAEPTAANLRAPEIARIDLPSYWGVHTAKPIYDFEIADYTDNSEARTRNLLLVASGAERLADAAERAGRGDVPAEREDLRGFGLAGLGAGRVRRDVHDAEAGRAVGEEAVRCAGLEVGDHGDAARGGRRRDRRDQGHRDHGAGEQNPQRA